MYYQLTEEQGRFKESVRRLADERVEPRAAEIDQKRRISLGHIRVV